jgi:ketosteroid isomerase-like protein
MVDVVRRALEAFQRGALEDALGLLAEDVTWDNRGIEVPGLDQVYEGREGVTRLLTEVGDAFEEYGIAGEREYEGAGDRVLVLGREYGRGRASGLSIDRPLAWVCTVRDGSIVHVSTHGDIDAARRRFSGSAD